jgi:4a-hydroxytetrahydrobiopterin dehydratase
MSLQAIGDVLQRRFTYWGVGTTRSRARVRLVPGGGWWDACWVSELARAHCEVCKPGTPPLPEEEAATLAGEVPDWERDGNRTPRRGFSLPDFRDAFGFVARVALLAEAEGHHPDIELGWGRAAVSLTTGAAGGLTRNDFIMAVRIDRLRAREEHR